MPTASDDRSTILCPRREFLRVGGGLAISGLAAAPSRPPRPPPRRGARSCILVYLLGGPPHLDMWDLKPDAPAEIRGAFQPIATSVPGLRSASICRAWPGWPTSTRRAVGQPPQP